MKNLALIGRPLILMVFEPGIRGRLEFAVVATERLRRTATEAGPSDSDAVDIAEGTYERFRT
jgi:hypothetical protein